MLFKGVESGAEGELKGFPCRKILTSRDHPVAEFLIQGVTLSSEGATLPVDFHAQGVTLSRRGCPACGFLR